MKINPHELNPPISGEQRLPPELVAALDTERALFKQYEIPLTERENAIIRDTLDAAFGVISMHGASSRVIEQKNIHIVQRGAVKLITHGESQDGICNTLISEAAVEQQATSIGLARIIAHEVFHLSGQVVSSGEGLDSELRDLEEGIVCELESQVLSVLEKSKLYQREIDAANRIKPWIDKLLQRHGLSIVTRQEMLANFCAISTEDAGEIYGILSSTEVDGDQLEKLAAALRRLMQENRLNFHNRITERKALRQVVDRILKRDRDIYRNREEIITIMVGAFVNGDRTKLRSFLQ